jgi:nitrate reductase (cytochrome)
MSTSRRNFLRGMATTAATAALAGCASDKVIETLDSSMTWGKAPCRYCGTGCGTLVGVRNGKVEAVTGDPACPVNRGTLCVKGYHLPAMLSGADRLTHPMLRKGDSYQQISWDEALDIVAEKFSETLEQHGPEALAMYGSGQWTIPEGYAALKWMKGGLRSNNIDPNARLCMASAVVGLVSTFGMDEPMGCYDDLDKADVFVLWGNNMAEMHPVLFSRVLARKRAAPHVRIIDITTRRTQTSDYADEVLMMKPQGDLAIANGIIRHLLVNDRVDHDMVDNHCTLKTGLTDIGYGTEDHFKFKEQPRALTFDEYRAAVDPYTPEKVEELSGVPAAQVVALAELFGQQHNKIVSTWCMGMNQHVRGTWINQIVYAAHLLSGKIGVPGSTPLSLTGQPSACGTVREVGTLAHALPGGRVVTNPEHRAEVEQLWGVDPGTIPPKPGTHAMAMFRALDRGDIKTMWVQVTNPFVTLPNLRRYRDGKRDRPDDSFLIVSDIYPTPTTELADLVLPSAGWVEKIGAFGNTERRTQQWDQLAEPPGEARPDVWQIAEVAKRMDMGHLFPWEGELEKNLFEEYRQLTLGHGKDIADWETLRSVSGLRWPVVDGRETPWRFVAPHDPYADPDKRIDFYGAKKTGGRAVIWFRPWEPAAEEPDDEYPYWLCTGRVIEHWHSGSMTRRVPQLHRAVPSAYCEIHPDDAAELGVVEGGTVKLTSRRGSLELPASIDGRAVPGRGNVFVPFFDEDVPINDLTLDAYCPMSKEPDYKKCAVKVERA